jgi:AICAR transformylase/IMP cyclohydrolase PurH
MMDIVCVVFVRGKVPNEMMIDMANERGITLLTTDERMFSACGKLYESGLRGGNHS